MPKGKSSKKTQSAPGLSFYVPPSSLPLIPRSRGVQSARNPRNDDRFWRPSSLQLKVNFTPVWRRWLKEAHPASFRPKYSMENLNAEIEEAAGNMLMLSGPLIDVYLTKLGEEVASRLRRNNSTGLATFADFIPSQAFTPIMYLIQRYGGQVSHFQGRGPYGKVEIKITSLEVLEAVLSGERSDGRNYLMRQHFDRERTPDKKVISHYRGVTEVLVNEALPFTMQYSSSRHKVKVSFYRQKYDRNGMVENSVLQAAGSS